MTCRHRDAHLNRYSQCNIIPRVHTVDANSLLLCMKVHREVCAIRLNTGAALRNQLLLMEVQTYPDLWSIIILIKIFLKAWVI